MFPWTDWQFWIVTLAVLGAVLWLVRGIIPRLGGRPRPARTRRVNLTIGGKRPV
jgi:hypothetical protein